jgi:hypothetical protein
MASANLEANDDAVTPSFVICREMPSDNDCDVMISGSEEHLAEAADAHTITHNGRADTRGLRDEVRETMRTEADDK